MTASLTHPRPAACPACNAAPAAEALAAKPVDARLMLSLPGIHCAGCISGVERALEGVAGVRAARVNLTLKRAAVEAGPEITAGDLVAEGVTRDLMHWVSAAIVLPAIVFTGQPFYVNAWSALRAGRLNMDVPITLAILLAVATSLYETIMSG